MIYTTVSRGIDKGDSLIRYNLETRDVETVVDAPDPELIGWFVVNQEWLVWSVGTRLYARSLETGEEQVVSTTRDLYAPELNGDLLAWDDLTPERTHQIVIRDLGKRETTVVAPLVLADLYNNFLAWNGDQLVWTDVVDGAGYYRLLDVPSGKTQDYVMTDIAFRFPGYVQTHGNRLYSINFNRTDEWHWAIQQVGYYVIGEGRFVPIVPEGFIANALVVGGGLVAIVDSGQELTLRPADAPEGDSTVFRPIEERIDFVEASQDGTLIATHESTDGSARCTLYLIEPR